MRTAGRNSGKYKHLRLTLEGFVWISAAVLTPLALCFVPGMPVEAQWIFITFALLIDWIVDR